MNSESRQKVEDLDLAADDCVARKNGVAADIRMGMEGLLGNNGMESSGAMQS